MQPLLRLTVLVEPDIQRLGKLALEAARVLSANPFRAAQSVLQLAGQLRNQALGSMDPLEVELLLHEGRLWLTWESNRLPLCDIRNTPSVDALEGLRQQLRQESETADPELLRQRNRKIREDLAAAQERAAAVEDLERMLEQKKEELEESIHQAETDSLTGIFNRGAYDLRFRQSLERCRRQHEPLCLILFDLDFFKEVNDTHGHQYGDAYLKKMANCMMDACRQHVDIPCRIGGDEFAMLVHAPLEVANRIAEQVLNAMEKRVSIGVAQFDYRESLEDLVKRCDSSLYNAKEQGRGRVVCDLQQPESTHISILKEGKAKG